MPEPVPFANADCVWLHYARPRPHWYLLADAEKQALEADWRRIRADDTAGRFQGRFHIRGQHDFETVEIRRFKDSQAAYAHWQALVDARYSEFFAFSNHIGLEMEWEPA